MNYSGLNGTYMSDFVAHMTALDLNIIGYDWNGAPCDSMCMNRLPYNWIGLQYDLINIYPILLDMTECVNDITWYVRMGLQYDGFGLHWTEFFSNMTK